jgi:hypothetical protein
LYIRGASTLTSDTPYVWYVPITLHVSETEGEAHSERILRPTFEDAYRLELKEFHRVATGERSTKTPPEDFREDLELFGDHRSVAERGESRARLRP